MLTLFAVMAVVGSAPCEPHFRFDMGRADSPVAEGWTQALPADTYSPERGFGWDREADGAFDRTETLPMTDTARDGVTAREDTAFRVDVGEGRWRVLVTVGDGKEHRQRMDVYVNGEQVADDLETRWTPWHGYATYRTVAAVTRAEEGRIEVGFHHDNVCNSILSVEAMPSVAQPERPWTRAIQGGAEARLRGLMGERPELDDALDWAVQLCRLAGRLDVVTSVYRQTVDDHFADEDALLAAERALKWAMRRGVDRPGMLERLDTIRTMREGLFYSRLRSYSAQAQRVPEHSKREKLAMDRLERIPQGDPLYVKAQFVLGQIHYWIGREGGDREEYAVAKRHFETVAASWPEQRLVRMYLGEEVDWGTEYTQGTEGAPEWAIRQREAMCRVLDVVGYWVEERQIENGEMGGWWGDDCEMLRSWPVTVLGTDDPVPLRGMRRLADGIWEESGIIENGYNRSRGDVQHTAEPVSDTQPFMVGADYGEPRFVERCMETTKLLRDLFTGVNEHGHRHFRSTEIGSTGIDENPPAAVDLPYCARAMKPAMWLAWYNRDPEAVKLLTEWSRAWCEDSLRTDRGKPKGIPPGAVAFATEQLGGYGQSWHKPGLYWSYFNFPGAMHLMFEQLLCTYGLTGGRSYLAPIEASLELVTKYHPDYPSGPEGGEEWAAQLLARFTDQYAKWRLMTGDDRFDEFLKQRGPAHLRFRLTGDTKPLEDACQGIINSTRHNFEMLTSEVRYTDRIAIGDTDHLFAMYTGGAGNASYYPSYAVSWKGVTKNFAGLVVEEERNRLRLWAHNFEPRSVAADIHCWRLPRGRYHVRVGEDRDHDGEFDSQPPPREERLERRGDAIAVGLPSRRTQIMELQMIPETVAVPRPPRPVHQPDVAVSARDITVRRDGDELVVTIPVHNIGSAEARAVTVKVSFTPPEGPSDGEWLSPVYSAEISELPAPADLEASVKTVQVRFSEAALLGDRVVVRATMADEGVEEITQVNNRVEVAM